MKYDSSIYDYRLILLFLVALLLLSPQSFSNNPSNRYLNAYKKYEDASCPIARDEIKHFVYFARDRESIHNHAFLKVSRFRGAQIMYSWQELEPSNDRYDFSIIENDLNYLKTHGKMLFIQLQDATFSVKYKGVPKYLETEEYDFGVTEQRNDSGKPEGWTAKRWNKNVRQRFHLLIAALGKKFDGKIEGINLQETSIGVSHKYDSSFSPKLYVHAIKENMKALKRAFPQSTKLQYANFLPDEWLPWDDKGYLKSLYLYGEEIGVGLGAPDLMVTRKGQLNHALAMMHENKFSVPLGIAIQDGNYIGLTGDNSVRQKRKNLVPMLHGFANDFLKVDYMFWVNQTPYFEEDVLPCFSN